MKSIYSTLIILACVLGFAPPATAGNFSIMTEEYPPFNYTENGQLTGLSFDVMVEVLKRVGHPNNIKVQSWSRAYNLILAKDNRILFSMTRTDQREPLFKWVGPIAANKWVFFAKKGSNITLNSLDDARKVKKIGTYKDDAAELFLKENGFTNIDSVIDDLANVKKLVAGRVDLWIVGYLQGLHKARTAVGDSAVLEKVFDVKDTQLYIAFSKSTPDAVIAKWQTALDGIKKDGTYDRILKKYM
jgi:polar amino acid transport system substrate-binding protein